MQQVLSAAQFFDGSNWHANVELVIDKGRIIAIRPCRSQPQAAYLVPGFIDLQVNGGGGVLFNNAPTIDTLRRMRQAHSRFGTTALLPTLITDQLAVMRQSADVIAAAIAAGEPGILGIHFEGPHLSAPKKGVHPLQHIRPLAEAEMQLYLRRDLGCVLVTLAPENVTPEQIQRLTAAGIKVWLGHSNASAEQVLQALAAGAQGFTHLYNAMSPLTSREPGMVGVALTDSQSWCGLILDGLHLHPLAAKLAVLAKPRGKVLLVTDAMSPVGTDETEFDFFAGKVTRQGNKLTDSSGALAGSVLDMAAAVRYAVNTLDLDLAESLRMAALYPAQALGLTDRGQAQPGHRADLVQLNAQLQVQQCWINGEAQLG